MDKLIFGEKPVEKKSKKTFSDIDIEGKGTPQQIRLLSDDQHKPYSLDVWPTIYRNNPERVKSILESPGKIKGLDFEFHDKTGRITMIGVALGEECASCLWDPKFGAWIQDRISRGELFVGHSVVGAEINVLRKAGFPTPLKGWRDSMISHYLCNQHLTKSPGKSDSDDPGAMGFMGLSTTGMLTTNHPIYKECRGAYCEGPCPIHDSFGYNAVDAYDSLAAYREHKLIMWKERIPESLELEWLELASYLHKMEEQGVNADREGARLFDTNLDIKKNALFPHNEPFNPGSHQQVKEYFSAFGIGLPSVDKQVIQKTLLTQLENRGYEDLINPVVKNDFENIPSSIILPDEIEDLLKLYIFKVSGKGLKPWMDDRYFGADGLQHPRWVYVGASTGRLSCVKPNYMNVASRGWGGAVRRLVIPRLPDHDWTKADKSQLELRLCLWKAQFDLKDVGADAFTWLVSQAESDFLEAGRMAFPATYADNPKKAARDSAKITSHLSDYLGGITLLNPKDLDLPSTRKLIDKGALRVYTKKYKEGLKKDWLFHGQIVAFNGIRLAEELFKDRSWESRRKALLIQEDIFFKRFGAIREWQQKILDDAESAGRLRSTPGTMYRLYGTPYEQAKVIAAWFGQGESALSMHGLMLKYARTTGYIPTLQVHDEMDFELPSSWTDKQVLEFYEIFAGEDGRLPGFHCPIKVSRGKCWKEADKKEPDPRDLREIGGLG